MASIYRVTTELTGAKGALYYSTMYFSASGTPVAADAPAAVANFWDDLSPYMHSTVDAQVQGEIAVIESTTGLQTGVVNVTPPALVNGGSSTEVLPYASQGLVRWRTGSFVNGRELRGRTFLPGLGETASTDGSPNSAIQSGANAAAAALIADPNSSFIIFSRAHKTFAVVTAGTLWTEFAILRSRRD